MSKLEEIIKSRYLVYDGAMGTEIQKYDLASDVWQDAEGCNELLCVTASEVIAEIHRSYLAAGADILKTNSFGTLPWVLDDYDLANETEKFAYEAAKIARSVADEFVDKPRFVAGSLGPGTKLPSLNHIDFETMQSGYKLAVLGLIRGGADLLLFETCQDPLQIKAALFGAKLAFDEAQKTLPIMVSATIETGGTMLIGTNAATFASIFEPFDLFSLGLNCGMGPDGIAKHLKILSESTNKPISIHSNAGLPLNVGGKTVYPMSPAEFASLQADLAELDGVAILGGCCGTTPDHIKALVEKLTDKTPKPPKDIELNALSSLFNHKPIFGEKLFLVGERSNATGSKAFRELLLAEDYEGTLKVASDQVKAKADALDVSVGFAGRDEMKDTNEVFRRYALNIPLPLMVDSTKPEAIEAALKLIGSRAIINSANLEDGEERFIRIATIAKNFGAVLVCLAIDEKGMAKSVEKKLEAAERMISLASQVGLPKNHLVFDLLTFTIASGDSEYQFAAVDTIEAIRSLRTAHPEVGAVLGVSNVSFGLKGYSREILNSVFLHHCHEAGLTMGIVNVKNTQKIGEISDEDREVCERLIFGKEGALFEFIDHFDKDQKLEKKSDSDYDLPTDQLIRKFLIDGEKDKMLEVLATAKDSILPETIVNELLIGAMKEVGEMFGDGRMQLPFVLQSAETMKTAVDFLAPYLPKKEGGKKLKLIIGTVKGDVHDVGKNLVDIILSNNGFDVVNIGIKVDFDDFIEAYQAHNADAIGMSGLLVKSTQVMQENLVKMQEMELKIPVLLGGAALNKKFVAEYCQSVYDAPVVYCKDAFDGVVALGKLAKGELEKTELISSSDQAQEKEEEKELPPFVPLDKSPIPTPPFWGRKVLEIDSETIFDWVDQNFLFKARWGYGKKGERDYKSLLHSEIIPAYERIKSDLISGELFKPVIVYGYFPIRADDQHLYIFEHSGWNKSTLPNAESLEIATKEKHYKVAVPRSEKKNRRSLTDYFETSRDDIAGFLIASSGRRLDEYVKSLHADGKYHEYHLVSSLAGELAEACAEIAHKQMRIDLGLLENEAPSFMSIKRHGYRGKRYAPGYAACPDLSFNRVIFDLLKPEELGVELTEHFQLDPEASTCAIMAHHHQAEYFAI